jgi:hypothetical protein
MFEQWNTKIYLNLCENYLYTICIISFVLNNLLLDCLNIYRVSGIKSKVSQLRTQLFGEVVQKLISKSYVEEGVTVTRRREYVTEIRP